jgi:hypothetical protein
VRPDESGFNHPVLCGWLPQPSGVNRSLIALAAPVQHAALIAAIFIINFLGLSIPVVIAGAATAHIGLHRTALVYCIAVAALVAVAAGSLMLRSRGPATSQGTS